jgi:hypothetical protein
MKMFSVFMLSNLVAVAAFAWPNVGDTTTYDLNIQSGAQSTAGVLQLQTLAIDTAKDQMTIQQIVNVGGQNNTQSQVVKFSDFQNFAQNVASVLANCTQYGGTIDPVTTPAGTFNACKVADDDSGQKGFIWYADVIYGWAKQVNTQSNGQVVTVTLKALTHGQ